MTSDWVDPAALATPGALDKTQIRQWREQGFALVNNLLPDALLQQAQADALAHFPAPGTPEAQHFTQFGSGQRFVFPAASDATNALTLHPALLGAAAELLGVTIPELRLTQSDLWPKYGPTTTSTADTSDPKQGMNNADQRIHCDYPNHTLTHPPHWDHPEAVEVIVYLNEVDQAGGATAVVPRRGADDPAYPWPITATPGVGDYAYVNDRATAEAYLQERAPEDAAFRAEHLYAREQRARYNFGSVLLYRHDTWHRGTPMLPDSLRLVLNLTFKKASSEWVNVLHPGWSWSMYQRNQPMEKLLAQASVDQRTVLGFPAPGSPYWTAETVAAVGARYGCHGMDMVPYAEGLT